MMDSPSENLTAAESFKKDDLEFRTVTTLLNFLGSSGRITLDNFTVPPQYRRQLKLLVALSSLLVREHEIVAVMAKRNKSGTTFILGSNSHEEPDATGLDIPDNESTASTSSFNSVMSARSRRTLVTLNPSFASPNGPEQLLLGSPAMDIGSDVFGYILKNWGQSFESHVHAFEILLNNSLSDPNDAKAVFALDMYSFFQSVPKVQHRLTHGRKISKMSPCLKDLAIAKPEFTNLTLVPSPNDRYKMSAMITSNANGTELNSVLNRFLSEPPTDTWRWFSAFHACFIWFLEILRQQIDQLGDLRGSKRKNKPAPLVLPENLINHAFNNLGLVRFFAWESDFFAAYLNAALPLPIPSATPLVTDDPLPTKNPESALKADITQTDREYEDVWSPCGGGERGGLDISTEFETGEEELSATSSAPVIHPCIQELRIISSNIEHLNALHRSAPKSQFRFELVQYSSAGPSMKPWRELIRELFPKESREKRVLKALLKQEGRKFNALHQPGTGLRFPGQSHCAAYLACLYSLSKSNEDISWTEIPASVLDSIRTCYSLLAPSNRCCPVCAFTIALLSAEAEATSGDSIHALSKHSLIFPCAFPIGLPRSIRARLLAHYRGELRFRLLALVDKDRTSSPLSAQSNPLSVNGRRDQERFLDNQRMLRVYQAGWETLDQKVRNERWEAARKYMPFNVLEGWWASMGKDKRMGLVPPAGTTHGCQ